MIGKGRNDLLLPLISLSTLNEPLVSKVFTGLNEVATMGSLCRLLLWLHQDRWYRDEVVLQDEFLGIDELKSLVRLSALILAFDHLYIYYVTIVVGGNGVVVHILGVRLCPLLLGLFSKVRGDKG